MGDHDLLGSVVYLESDFGIYTSPWVSGTRASAYFGPISENIFVEYCKEKEFDFDNTLKELLCRMVSRSQIHKANAIVGFELSIDPFYEESEKKGYYLIAIGTIAHLEPLF